MNNSLKIVCQSEENLFHQNVLLLFFFYFKTKTSTDKHGFLQGSFSEMFITKLVFVVVIHLQIKYLRHALPAVASLFRHPPSVRQHNEAEKYQNLK